MLDASMPVSCRPDRPRLDVVIPGRVRRRAAFAGIDLRFAQGRRGCGQKPTTGTCRQP